VILVQHNTTFVLNHIICEATNTSSVKCLISKARKCKGSQDKITKELWEHINSMYHFINDPELPEN
jgi:uncharacterized alpha-E superfamily protein